MNFKIGDRVFVRGHIDEIRKDTVIIRNNGGYFGTIPSEVITGELPSAYPERKKGRWISCSERLPEVTGSYLVTVHPNYIMPGSIHVDMLSWFDGKWWFDLDGQDVEFPDPIIAWMSLPEPYGGESE